MKSRRPHTVLWLELGPHTPQEEKPLWHRGKLGYGERGAKLFRQRKDAEYRRDQLIRRGYLECRVVEGTVTWHDDDVDPA